MTLQENIVKLHLFGDLKTDWNGYGAKPFTKRLFQICADILRKLDYQPEVFPTGRNTIQFEYNKDEEYLEFEIGENKIGCYQDAPNEIPQEGIIQESQIYEIVNKFMRQKDEEKEKQSQNSD